MKRMTVNRGNKIVDCFFCHTPTETNADTSALLCGRCVSKLTGAPELPKPQLTAEARKVRKMERTARREAKRAAQLANPTRGRGRGWHLKRVFEWEGQFYSFGQPITAEQARELAGA